MSKDADKDQDEPLSLNLEPMPDVGALTSGGILASSEEDAPIALEPSPTPEPQDLHEPSEPSEPKDTATTEVASDDPPSPKGALDEIRQFADAVTVGQPDVSLLDPYSLLIIGTLKPDEQEKLLDVLAREKIGISENEIKPQFEGDRILIPRISEYAGVLLVQALRSASVEMQLGPADQIFAGSESEHKKRTAEKTSWSSSTDRPAHPAEEIPLTIDSSVPQLTNLNAIDTLTATAILETEVVEAEKSPEYQEILERLKNELRYRAYRKGAMGIINFTVTLTSLSMPAQYRLTVMGVAVTGNPMA